MNIDIKKLSLQIHPHSATERDRVKRIAEKCTVPDKACNDCGRVYDNGLTLCARCIINPKNSNNFQPHVDVVSRLFIDAPIVIPAPGVVGVGRLEDGSVLTTYNACTDNILRLPTVEEAPRNVWLAPWKDEPESLFRTHRLLRLKNGDIYPYECGIRQSLKWRYILAIMILADLENPKNKG